MVEGTYIFDCEVFAHDWLFVFKEVATGEYTVIWNDNDEVLAFMERNPYLGGFNNKHYDNHILKAVMCGFTPEQVKEINDLIIVHELNGWDIPALREYRVYFDSFDLKDDCQDGMVDNNNELAIDVVDRNWYLKLAQKNIREFLGVKPPRKNTRRINSLKKKSLALFD